MYCLGPRSQNPGWRKVDLVTRSICWNKEEKLQQKKRFYRTAWTHIWIPLLRELDLLESSANRGGNISKALVSLCWSSESLHLKEPSNQIPHKSIKLDPIRLSQIWKKVSVNLQMLCSSAYQNKFSQKYSKCPWLGL